MPIELKVPEVGESITEVQIGTWKTREGEGVAMDDSNVEIESDKATAMPQGQREEVGVGQLPMSDQESSGHILINGGHIS